MSREHYSAGWIVPALQETPSMRKPSKLSGLQYFESNVNIYIYIYIYYGYTWICICVCASVRECDRLHDKACLSNAVVEKRRKKQKENSRRATMALHVLRTIKQELASSMEVCNHAWSLLIARESGVSLIFLCCRCSGNLRKKKIVNVNIKTIYAQRRNYVSWASCHVWIFPRHRLICPSLVGWAHLQGKWYRMLFITVIRFQQLIWIWE